MLRAKIDAADVVQETFIEATHDFAAFRGETGWRLARLAAASCGTTSRMSAGTSRPVVGVYLRKCP